MPSATILSPQTGDTVNEDNVVISVAYYNFSAGTDLKCKIATCEDIPYSATGTGMHTGNTITGVPNGSQTAVAYTDSSGPLSQQIGVNVTGGLAGSCRGTGRGRGSTQKQKEETQEGEG